MGKKKLTALHFAVFYEATNRSGLFTLSVGVISRLFSMIESLPVRLLYYCILLYTK